jgi:hypothetical protein
MDEINQKIRDIDENGWRSMAHPKKISIMSRENVSIL